MCRQVSCKKCKGITWSGCGQHVDQVMAGVPSSARCSCSAADQPQGLLSRLFGPKG